MEKHVFCGYCSIKPPFGKGFVGISPKNGDNILRKLYKLGVFSDCQI